MRLMVYLDSEETNALAAASRIEMRDPREQIRWYVRRSLQDAELLPRDNDLKSAVAETKGDDEELS